MILVLFQLNKSSNIIKNSSTKLLLWYLNIFLIGDI